jgi:hypothetical protein
MSNAVIRWIALGILLLLALSVIGLIAYARGPEHHRGDDVGTHGTKVVVVVPR